MEANPYSTPVANLYGNASGTSDDAVSPGTIAALAGTKPWVRFMSVMMWIGAAIMLIAAAGMGILGAVGGPVKTAIDQAGAFGGAPLIAIAIIYGVLALLYVYPAVKLWSYATRIATLSTTRSVADLNMALNQQRQFWKFCGIMVIIMLCAYVVLIIGFVGFGAAAAMKAGALPK